MDEIRRSDAYRAGTFEIDLPTLLLHGRQDFIPVAPATRIAEAVPRGRSVVLDCGQEPEAFATHVAAFLGAS